MPTRAYDDVEDFERHTIFGRVDRLTDIPVRLDCGTSDPFIDANRALAGELTNVEAHFEPGGHEHAWWRAHAPAELAWLAQYA
jgi:enterochelin esterase-like enzyme